MRGVLVFTLVALCTPAWAQEAAQVPPPQPPAAEAPAIDATKLGVSLSRIQKGLRTAEARERSNADGLRLEFNVQVYGAAPRIDVIPEGEELVFGQVPGSAPTHRQLIEHVTPQIYRTPTMPVSAFAALAAQWLADKSKKTRCEEEIANYRALIMQGVNVSAPRCTQ
jgi:hypothetical protein